MNRRRLIFPDILGKGKPICYVHPLQQKFVLYIMEGLPEEVMQMIAFGSAIRLDHWVTSDLDTCHIWNGKVNMKLLGYVFDTDSRVDTLCFDNVEAFLENAKHSYCASYHVLREGVTMICRLEEDVCLRELGKN